MPTLRILLITANFASMAVLLAIPIGKLLDMVAQQMDAATVFGWFVFFVPLLAASLTLWGIQFNRPALTRPFVAFAMLGSFLTACLSLYTFLMGPIDFSKIAIGAAILYGFNVLTLWEPFKDYLESATDPD